MLPFVPLTDRDVDNIAEMVLLCVGALPRAAAALAPPPPSAGSIHTYQAAVSFKTLEAGVRSIRELPVHHS